MNRRDAETQRGAKKRKVKNEEKNEPQRRREQRGKRAEGRERRVKKEEGR